MMSDQHKTVFTLEVMTNPLGYTLGAFYSTPWPAWCRGPDAEEVYQAKAALAKAAGVSVSHIQPDVQYVQHMLKGMQLRTRFDAKALGPFVVNTDCLLERDEFTAYIESLPTSEVECRYVHNKTARL